MQIRYFDSKIIIWNSYFSYDIRSGTATDFNADEGDHFTGNLEQSGRPYPESRNIVSESVTNPNFPRFTLERNTIHTTGDATLTSSKPGGHSIAATQMTEIDPSCLNSPVNTAHTNFLSKLASKMTKSK